MNFWTAVVVIVAIAALANVLRARYGARDGTTEDRQGSRQAGSRADAALEREVMELKERIAVLERIATDERQSRAIADEIEQLRNR